MADKPRAPVNEGTIPGPGSMYGFTFATNSPKTKLGFHCVVVKGDGKRGKKLREARVKMAEWEANG